MKRTKFIMIFIFKISLLLGNLLACNSADVTPLVIEREKEAEIGTTDNNADTSKQDSNGAGDLDTDVDSDADSDSDDDADSVNKIDGGLDTETDPVPLTIMDDKSSVDSESDQNNGNTYSESETDVSTDSNSDLDTVTDSETFYLPDEMGPYKVEVSRENLKSVSYADAQLFYPDILEGEIPAISMSSGWGQLQSVNWLSKRIASHGIVVLAVTPNDMIGNVTVWETAHKKAIEKLKDLAEDENSPLAGHIDVSNLGMVGIAEGGGGVTLAANDKVGGVAAVVAVGPWYRDPGPGSRLLMSSNSIRIPIQYIAGSLDTLSVASDVFTVYRFTPVATQKQYVAIVGLTRSATMSGESESVLNERIANQAISFLKVFLCHDSRYMAYISASGTEFDNNREWFLDSAATF